MFCYFNKNKPVASSDENTFFENLKISPTSLLVSLAALLTISLLVSGVLAYYEVSIFSAIGSSWSMAMMVSGGAFFGLTLCILFVKKILTKEVLTSAQADKYQEHLKLKEFFYYYDIIHEEKKVRVKRPEGDLDISDFPYPYNDMLVSNTLIFKCNPEFQHVSLQELISRAQLY